MQIDTNPALINDVLNRGTVDVLVKKDLEQKLLSGRQLTVKFGIDPSGKDLHIGHMVPIGKLSQLQKMGHKIVILLGNFTGQIGDPTGKSEARKIKTQAELEENAKRYLEQVSKLVDIKNITVAWNAEWLGKLNFSDIIKLSANFTVSQMMERDMFQERIKSNKPISVHEFMYPLMQGYDSVALNADIEIGGTDQTFNLLAGRTLQKAYGQNPQDIITVPILEGTDGVKKMGKSENNYIGVTDSPKDMFGKVMSIPDNCILKYFELATPTPIEKLVEYNKALKEGENPRNLKVKLAKEIIAIYHNASEAETAEKEFIEIFSKGGLPNEIEEFTFDKDKMNIVDMMISAKTVTSKSEARRLIEQGGVKLNNEKVSQMDLEVDITKESVIQVGKRRFFRAKKQ